MAPIKFEDNIREKLQDRELTPSPKTWEQLEAQLEKQPQGRNKNYLWLGIAASFIGILVVSFLMNLNGAAEVENILVETNEVIEQEDPILRNEILENQELTNTEAEDPTEASEVIAPNKITSEEIAVENVKESSNQESNAVVQIKDPVFIQETNTSEAIATAVDNRKVNTVVEIKKEEIKKSFIDQKVEEVVAQIGKDNTKITSEEIDALLANAQRDIQTRKILDETTRKVDATALLDEVEFELERSFRDKVFDALGDRFNKVRTAVSERNN